MGLFKSSRWQKCVSKPGRHGYKHREASRVVSVVGTDQGFRRSFRRARRQGRNKVKGPDFKGPRPSDNPPRRSDSPPRRLVQEPVPMGLEVEEEDLVGKQSRPIHKVTAVQGPVRDFDNPSFGQKRKESGEEAVLPGVKLSLCKAKHDEKKSQRQRLSNATRTETRMRVPHSATDNPCRTLANEMEVSTRKSRFSHSVARATLARAPVTTRPPRAHRRPCSTSAVTSRIETRTERSRGPLACWAPRNKLRPSTKT